MTDEEDASKTKTEPMGGGNNRGVVTLILGLVVMTLVFGFALFLDR